MVSITINGVAYDVPSSAADTNWAADQVAFEQALAAYINTVATNNPLVWTQLPDDQFLNSWENQGVNPVAYAKDAFGTVYVRGNLINGTPDAAAFTLPVGFRPPLNSPSLCPCSPTVGGIVRVVAVTDGTVVITPATADADPAAATYLNFNFSTIATPP